MSDVQVADITELKTVSTTTDKSPRWVIEERAWYGLDRLSEDFADDHNVVEPLSGVGRWYRQYSVTPNSVAYPLIWLNYTISVNAAPGTGYIYNLSAGDRTVTLPESPSINDFVGITKMNAYDTGNNRVIIARNGNLIGGEAYDRQIVNQGQTVILLYLGGSVGWSVQSDRSLWYSGATISFPAPANIDNSQDGIFHYAGKGYSAGGTWSNPFSSNAIRLSRYADVATSSPSFLVDRVYSGTSVATTTCLNYDGTGASNIGQLESGFLHVGFRAASGRISQVRLEKVYWLNYNTSVSGVALNYTPKWVDVFGTNNPNIASILEYGSVQNVVRRYMLPQILVELGLEKIASVNLNTVADWATHANGANYKHRYIQVGATQYYSDFVLLFTRGMVNQSTSYDIVSSNSVYLANEMEFYGDYRPILIP